MKIVGQKDAGVTGNFEISVDGKLVSSKKAVRSVVNMRILSLTHPVKQTQGDGFWYDDKTKYDNVFNVIEKAGVVSKVSNEEIETPAVSSCTIL